MQSIGESLLTWKKLFSKLVDTTEVPEEKNLYQRIVAKSSSMFVNVAVLLNLKLRQEGLGRTGILVSEMSHQEHADYQRKWRALKKDWHLFDLIKQVVDGWTSTLAIPTTGIGFESPLHSDVSSSIPILKLKESVDKGSEKVHVEVEKTLHEFDGKIGKIVNRFHEDRIPQLLTQMEQASIVRGKYFYLSLIFIAAPLLVNLLILPQLSEGAMLSLRVAVAITGALAIVGVIILLLYIHKMLNV
jgi:hypothetical protein